MNALVIVAGLTLAIGAGLIFMPAGIIVAGLWLALIAFAVGRA